LETKRQKGLLRIGELAAGGGTSADTVRYYERVGLLGTPARTASGYRAYTQADLGRLQFIRRAKRRGLALDEIRGLLGLAEEGECHPLRRHVAELLRRKMDECDAQQAELQAFRASVEERYHLALQRQDEPAVAARRSPRAATACPSQLRNWPRPQPLCDSMGEPRRNQLDPGVDSNV
jgi:MerR family mercuric resistance operon transcriptional regulator